MSIESVLMSDAIPKINWLRTKSLAVMYHLV